MSNEAPKVLARRFSKKLPKRSPRGKTSEKRADRRGLPETPQGILGAGSCVLGVPRGLGGRRQKSRKWAKSYETD